MRRPSRVERAAKTAKSGSVNLKTSQYANMIGSGLSYYYSTVYLGFNSYPVQWWNRTWTGNLSGYEDSQQQFSGNPNITNLNVRLAHPKTTDEIMDPAHGPGYTTDEYWTMLYPSSAVIRYRDLILISGSEGPAVYIVTSPTAALWGQVQVVKKATIKRVTNASGGGQPVSVGWPA